MTLDPEYSNFIDWAAGRFMDEGLTLDRAIRWLSAETGEVHEAMLLADGVIPRKRHLHRDLDDVAAELGDVVVLGLIAMVCAGKNPAEVLAMGVEKSRQRWKEWDERE